MKAAILIGIILIVFIGAVWFVLPILSSAFSFVGCDGCFRDPTEKTRELLNNLYDKPEAIKTTTGLSDPEWTPQYVLSADSLAEGSPAEKDQLCMSLGDYEADPEFSLQTTPYHKIRWNGSTTKITKIFVVCNINRELLLESIKGTTLEKYNPNCDICEGKGKCCLIILKEL